MARTLPHRNMQGGRAITFTYIRTVRILAQIIHTYVQVSNCTVLNKDPHAAG